MDYQIFLGMGLHSRARGAPVLIRSEDNHIESDYLSETLSQHPRLYRIIELHQNDKFNMTDSEQLSRENNPPKKPITINKPHSTETDRYDQ